MTEPSATLDFAFLDDQTFGDAGLARDLLELFVAQAQRLVPRLPELAYAEQSATAHLLRGSCQGIGAIRAADLLQRFEDAAAVERRVLCHEVARAFAEVEAAAARRIAAA